MSCTCPEFYSHSHYDHITGGKPFKDLGARFIAHKNAKAQLERLRPANIVLPDEATSSAIACSIAAEPESAIILAMTAADTSRSRA